MGSIPITRSSFAVTVAERVGVLVVATMLSLHCSQSVAADVSGYLTLTTDYVWRGVTQSDGHGSVQLGGEIAFDTGIFAGIWGSTIDIDNGGSRQRDTELTAYLGYGRGLGAKWSIGINAAAITYPAQGGSIDYDYEEYMVSVNYDDRAWLEYAYSPDLFHSGQESDNIELYAEWPVGKRLIIGGGAGYYDVSKLVGDGYAYWQLGLTWPISRFDIDLRYHDTSRWVPAISSPDRADPRVAFSLRLTF